MRSRSIFATLAIVLCLTGAAVAQEFRATLKGRVVDQGGGSIAGCAVQVRNVETNEVRSVKTDEAGDYTVGFLQPGKYSIAFEATGFKRLTREGLQLEVGQTAGVNVTLEIGAVTQMTTVTAETPMLETEKADRGQVIDSQQVLEFPLNGRSPYLLAILSPGVNYNGEARFSRPFDLPHSWRINGGLNQNNEFLLDGAPNNAQAGNNSVGLVPSVDAVQEFKVQTSSYDAQYGKTSGGILNVSLKSGTNALHGTLYEFARRSAWDANTFALNAQRQPRKGHYLFDSGGTVGGPVYLPKLYNGKNKAFFFFSYEDWRESSPETAFNSVPAPEMIDQPDASKCPGGIAHCADFSNLVRSDGVPILIYDPLAGNPSNRTPFPGNKIPADRVNPIARRILSYFPAPNTRNSPSAAFYSQNNFFRSSFDVDRFHNLALKLDQNIGAKHHLFLTVAHNVRDEYRAFNPVPRDRPGENAQNPLERINYVSTLDWVGTFSPTLIANVRIGWNRNGDNFHDLPNERFDLASLGFPASMVRQLALPTVFGDYNFNNYSSLGRIGRDLYTNSFTVHPSITKIYKSHFIKTGLDFRLIVFNQVDPGEHDVFRLEATRDFTRRQFDRDDPGIQNGNSLASFLLGFPSGGRADVRVLPSTVQRYYAPYVQDDWKVSRKLTLNLGLRIDFNLAPFERRDRIDRGFDANAVSPVDQMVNHTIPGFGTLPALNGGLLFANVNSQPRRVSNLDATAIQPRIGFAYQMMSKLVWRGGFGRYFLNPNNDYLQYSGFSARTQVVSSLDGGRTPNMPGGAPLLNNPFPIGVNQPTGSALGALTFVGQGFNFFDPNFHVPHVHQFSLGFQYELPWHSSLDVSYVGSRGYELESNRDFNEPDLALRQKCNPLEGGTPAFCEARFQNPFFGLPAFAGTSRGTDRTLTRWELSRPFPQFGGVNQRGRNDGKTWYNSMQATYRVRARKSLDLSVAYTLAKQIEQAGFLDVQKNIMNRSLVEDDQPHSLKVGSVWQLPFGTGRKFFNSSNGFWGRLATGWEHTMVVTYFSGRPQGLPDNVIYQNPATAKLSNIDWSGPVVQGWRPCVAEIDDALRVTPKPYSIAAGCGADASTYNFLAFRFSNGAHNPRLTNFRDGRLRLQSAPSVDMSLNKSTRLTERVSLQFRAEAFNLFNKFRYFRQVFNNDVNSSFNNAINLPNFGTIIKSSIGDGGNVGYPRHIQLALKLIF